MIKDLEYYLRREYIPEIIPDTYEGGYAARFPELPGCLTCGETIEEVKINAEDAKREWFISAIEEHLPILNEL